MQIFWHYKTFALTPLHRQSQIYFHEQHRRESFLQPNSSMGFFVLLHEDFFSSSFLHPSLTPCVQFPAALLSLSFSLLHLSFLTHSLGVRFLQLVHISAPISRTPLLLLFSLLSLCTPSLLHSLPPPPPLPHADLCLSWLAVGASESREGWVDSHSVM